MYGLGGGGAGGGVEVGGGKVGGGDNPKVKTWEGRHISLPPHFLREN